MVPSPLTVVDFGYEATMLEPLERRVTPGSYAVDVAIAYDRCAAMRGPAWTGQIKAELGRTII